jgi:hypothetical protein
MVMSRTDFTQIQQHGVGRKKFGKYVTILPTQHNAKKYQL